MIRRRWLLPAVSLIATLVGVLFGYFGRDMFVFQASREVDIIEFYKIALGAVVVVYLQLIWQGREGSREREKNLIIDSLTDVIRKIDDIRKRFKDLYYHGGTIAETDRRWLASHFKTVSTELSTIENLIVYCKVPERITTSFKPIVDKSIQMKQAMTGPTGTYTGKNFADATGAYHKLREQLLRMIVDINRL